jgi:UDP-N-acetylmuramate--alanine ligase
MIKTPKKPKFKIIKYSFKQKEAAAIRKTIKIPGEHNVSNSLGVLALSRVLGIPDKTFFKAISEYQGAWRRFEIKEAKIGNKEIILISDYGHHPSEIKATLEAARQKFNKRKIWCVFQPHQYQRTFYLFDDFIRVFKEAPVDRVLITDIYDVAGREKEDIKNKVSSEKLAKKIDKGSVAYLPKEKIKNYLKKELKGNEVVIIMGAGDIYDISKDLIKKRNARV